MIVSKQVCSQLTVTQSAANSNGQFTAHIRLVQAVARKHLQFEQQSTQCMLQALADTLEYNYRALPTVHLG